MRCQRGTGKWKCVRVFFQGIRQKARQSARLLAGEHHAHYEFEQDLPVPA